MRSSTEFVRILEPTLLDMEVTLMNIQLAIAEAGNQLAKGGKVHLDGDALILIGAVVLIGVIVWVVASRRSNRRGGRR